MDVPFSLYPDVEGVHYSINGFLQSYEGDLIELKGTMDAWSDDIIGEAIRVVEEFTCLAYCGFMKVAYESMHQSLCTTTLGGFQMVSLALIFLAVCNIPVVITSAIMVVRLRGVWFREFFFILLDYFAKGVVMVRE